MSAERVFSRDNPWFTTSVGLTAAIAVAAAIVGFVWLPYAQPNLRPSSLWDAICGAAGVPRARSDALPVSRELYHVEGDRDFRNVRPPERVVDRAGRDLGVAMRNLPWRRGGRRTLPASLANIPARIYKELKDFKDGARSSSVMTPLAAVLSDSDMRDLAAYYAYLPRDEGSRGRERSPPRPISSAMARRSTTFQHAALATTASMAGAPWLKGQPSVYLKAQLAAFADGGRHNDIDEQMRNIARRMTAAESRRGGRLLRISKIENRGWTWCVGGIYGDTP